MVFVTTKSRNLMVTLCGLLGARASVDDNCVNVRAPGLDHNSNTKTIQQALDHASATKGCVSIGGGDYAVQQLFAKSNSLIRIEHDTRLMAVINVTKTAVLRVDKAVNVTLTGGGMLDGQAGSPGSWNYFDPKDNRFNPSIPDGNPLRPNLLLVSHSKGVVVRDLHLHNSTDWTFRLDNSSDIYVDNVDIYGDSR
jgi:polygalacturonase